MSSLLTDSSAPMYTQYSESKSVMRCVKSTLFMKGPEHFSPVITGTGGWDKCCDARVRGNQSNETLGPALYTATHTQLLTAQPLQTLSDKSKLAVLAAQRHDAGRGCTL